VDTLCRSNDADGEQIGVTNTVPLTKIDHAEIKAVLSEYRLANAAVAIHQPDCTVEDLIDVVEANRWVRAGMCIGGAELSVNRVYVPAIFVLNKIDAISIEELDLLYKAGLVCWVGPRSSSRV
jgi:ribosome-interacting GTPase 1